MKLDVTAALVSGLLAQACWAGGDVKSIGVQVLPEMPVPITNNAVALLPSAEGFSIYSFLGLESGKTWADTSLRAMRYTAGPDAGSGSWSTLEPVPGEHGRLAASAIAAGGAVFLFGGYTVASDHSEKSIPEVYRLDPATDKLEVFTTMPVPVEDSVLAVHQDRWIYMVSGWHDLGNVNLVQILDVETGTWAQGTPFPGAPVFGHAGGMVRDSLVICDGVKIEYRESPQPRAFLPSNECWKGEIDAENYRRIDWRPIEPHPGKPMYRMAATGDGASSVWFAGGSDNPYNFNGIGYNGTPSNPAKAVFRYDVANARWVSVGELGTGTMDHRGLLHRDGWFYIVGGMRAGQEVTGEFFRFRMPAEP